MLPNLLDRLVMPASSLSSLSTIISFTDMRSAILPGISSISSPSRMARMMSRHWGLSWRTWARSAMSLMLVTFGSLSGVPSRGRHCSLYLVASKSTAWGNRRPAGFPALCEELVLAISASWGRLCWFALLFAPLSVCWLVSHLHAGLEDLRLSVPSYGRVFAPAPPGISRRR